MKLKPTLTQFLNANKKAFLLWEWIEKKDYEVDKLEGSIKYRTSKRDFYIAFNRNNNTAYVVCPSGSRINQSTGMFVFETKENAQLFLDKMGNSINYLFPKCID